MKIWKLICALLGRGSGGNKAKNSGIVYSQAFPRCVRNGSEGKEE